CQGESLSDPRPVPQLWETSPPSSLLRPPPELLLLWETLSSSYPFKVSVVSFLGPALLPLSLCLSIRLSSSQVFILSLNLSRLLPSSSHFLLPSHGDVPLPRGPPPQQQRQAPPCLHLHLPPHSYYFSSSYSSSSPSSSTSSTSSSLCPTSSPSSSLLPTAVILGRGASRCQRPACTLQAGGQEAQRRQKSRKFGDSQLPSLGTKTPPPSPHRVNEVRMIGGQIIGGVAMVSPERMSPIRRSLRLDSNGAGVEIVNRSRGSGSSSSTSSVFLDSPLGQPERLLHGHVTDSNPQSERMKAMEEQIASLAGLVHSALSMGSDVPAVKALSENAECKHLKNGAGASPEVPVAVIDSVSPPPPSDSGLQQSLVLAKGMCVICDSNSTNSDTYR
ncbi:hypothetical protein NQZ68_020868, partial [Dissostichus eleginoides]